MSITTKRIAATTLLAGVLISGALITASTAQAATLSGRDVPSTVTLPPGSSGTVPFTWLHSAPGDYNQRFTATFTAPPNTTFPAQSNLPFLISTNGGTTFAPAPGASLPTCTVANAGSTLSCTSGSQENTLVPYKAGDVWRFSPTVRVDDSAPKGVVLGTGTGTFTYTTGAPYSGSGTLTVATPEAKPLVVTSPAAGSVSTTSTPTLAGTGDPGARISATSASGAAVCDPVVVSAGGTWSCTTVPLPAGASGITVSQRRTDGVTTTQVRSFTVAASAATPLINPVVGGAAALMILAGLGAMTMVRRRPTQI